jgi:hypothetical protein
MTSPGRPRVDCNAGPKRPGDPGVHEMYRAIIGAL